MSKSLVLVIASLALAAHAVAAPGDAFRGRAYFGSGGTTMVATADVDADGDIDAVTHGANMPGSALQVWRGDGAGSGDFVAPSITTIPSGATRLVLGDLDADAKPDAVLACRSTNQVYVLRNLGGGTYAPPLVLTFPGPGSSLNGIAIGEVTGDAHVDLIGVCGKQIVRASGLGGFAFAAPVNASSAHPATLLGLALGDFDSDGDLDVIASGGGAALVFANSGLGAFSLASAENFATTAGTDLATDDFNGDGHIDAALGGHDLSIVWGAGANIVEVQQKLDLSYDSYATDLALGDVNGDGATDILLGEPSHLAWLFVGSPTSFGLFATFHPLEISTDFGGVTDVALADLDANGFDDPLIAGDIWGPLTTRLSTGAGDGFGVHSLPHGEIYRALSDFDLDGDDDVVAMEPYPGTLRTYVNVASGDVVDQGIATSVPGGFWVATADLDGDGRRDAVIRTNYQLEFWRALPNGTFANVGVPVPIPSAGCSPSGVTSGDVDNDGNADLILWYEAATSSCKCTGSVWFMDGNFHVTKSIDFPGTYDQPSPIAVGDLNGDSFDDVVRVNNNLARVSFGAPNGSLQAPFDVGIPATVYSVAVGDFTGDGLLDIAVGGRGTVGTTSTGTVQIFVGNGIGGFVAGILTALPKTVTARTLEASDLDGDGDTDLLASITAATIWAGPYFATLTNHSNGTFNVATYHHPSFGAKPLTTVRIDGDARRDLMPLEGSTYELQQSHAVCPGGWIAYGAPCAGINAPVTATLTGAGCPTPGGTLTLRAENVEAASFGLLVLGASTTSVPFDQCGLYVAPPYPVAAWIPTPGTPTSFTTMLISGTVPPSAPPCQVVAQFFQPSRSPPFFAATNALRILIQ